VGVHFNENSNETFNDKVLRLAKNDLTFGENCATIGLPQQVGCLKGVRNE